jgi:hypothetical protein
VTPGRTGEQLEQLGTHVRSTGPVPPEGCRLVLIGGECAITVWDSEEARDNFVANRLRPAYDAIGLSLDDLQRMQFEVETLVAGDLVGPAS